MPVYLFILMIYYRNFSLGAYLYLSLHGSYGKFIVLMFQVFSGYSKISPSLIVTLAATQLSAAFWCPSQSHSYPTCSLAISWWVDKLTRTHLQKKCLSLSGCMYLEWFSCLELMDKSISNYVNAKVWSTMATSSGPVTQTTLVKSSSTPPSASLSMMSECGASSATCGVSFSWSVWPSKTTRYRRKKAGKSTVSARGCSSLRFMEIRHSVLHSTRSLCSRVIWCIRMVLKGACAWSSIDFKLTNHFEIYIPVLF